MDKLQSAKLYGNGLVEIDSPELVSRYNDCLATLGLPATTLQSFRVDGVGWSPEVAEEQGNPFYLSHGEATPLAILLTPDQQNKPVYMALYSYQRQLMREYWNRYAREVVDLTSMTGISIELDHGLSQLRSPTDLLLVRDVVVRTTVTGGLIKAFNEQRALISEFTNRGDSWFNQGLRECIIASARTYGDLRAHHFLIADWSFTQTDFFRTSAFGGLFILRGLQKYKEVLIHEDDDLKVPDNSAGTGVFEIGDRKWLRLLLSEGIVKVNVDNPARLRQDVQRIKESVLADAACAQDPEMDYRALTSAQRRGLVNRLGKQLWDIYYDLERVELQLDGPDPVQANNLPAEVQFLLCQPAPGLAHDKFRVVNQLLARYRPTDVWRLYRHNKRCFYDNYQSWSQSKQRWAISLIREHLDNNLTD